MKDFRALLMLSCAATLLTSCGGGGNSTSQQSTTSTPTPTATPNPMPQIAAISPNSSEQGDPAFTLSVVGSNFISSSVVNWNGTAIAPTTVVNSSLLTIDVPASTVAAPGPDSVTVVNPSPGGGTSSSSTFSVPCPISGPASSPAANQTRAQVGAYYFDGWSGPLTNFHFQGLPFGPYQGRQPLSGWQDFGACSVEQQLAAAHNFGIDFFIFDWYYNTQVNASGENLNSALQITKALPNRHAMDYAILYVDSSPFIVQPPDWPAAVNEWVSYMSDPAYVIMGDSREPVLFILDVNAMRTAFGSSVAVSSALNQLRAAAQAAGLPGVYVVGGIAAGYDHNTQTGTFPDTSAAVADGYDALTLYNYSFGTVSGEQPFSLVSEAGKWIWSQAVTNSKLPFIPVAMDGWDPRPWAEGNVWFNRTPPDVSGFVNDEINWTKSNTQLWPNNPLVNRPLVLIEAWNEIGEGSYLIPTVDDGTTYGDALATMLTGP